MTNRNVKAIYQVSNNASTWKSWCSPCILTLLEQLTGTCKKICSSVFQALMALLWVSTATYQCSCGIWLAPSSVIALEL